VTIQLRTLVGATALVAGLWYFSGATAAPPLAKDTYKKAAEADVAQLQKHLETCVAAEAAGTKDAKRFSPTAKSMAMILAAYAEATGDDAFKTQALKVAMELTKKVPDYKAALEDAKKLALKPGAGPLKPAGLDKMNKFALDEVMSPFRVGLVGGLNIEKDIRSIRDGKMAIVPADVEVLAARVAVITEYATFFPNDKALTNKANTDEWLKLSKDSIDLSKKLAEEAAKGTKADKADITKLIKSLDAKCVLCHNKFRDD
jgi:hypothetical protein